MLGFAGRYIGCVLPAVLLISACTVPNHMHVTEGIAPQNIDTNVRFRTTYYFRVFDYCWQLNEQVGNKKYRDIIPASDVMYRYRMTGKASALGSKIKFESGTVDADDIDPFGSDAVYRDEIGGYVTRTASEAKTEYDTIHAANLAAQSAASQSEHALDRFNALAVLHSQISKQENVLPAGASTTALDAQRVKIEDAMTTALAVYVGTAATDAELNTKLDKVGSQLTTIQADVNTLKLTVPDISQTAKTVATETANAFVAKLQAIVDQAKAAPGAASSGLCPVDSILRKGFEVMGPEGMVPFDQNKRLILAMHTSAEPLIDTLQEYAGRVLKDKANPAEQLLPLVQENLRVVQAQRALDEEEAQLSGTGGPKVEDITNSLLDVFDVKPANAKSGSANP